MDDNNTSFFSRFYDRVTGKDVNFEHVRNKCEPGQRSFVVNLFKELVKRYDERRNDISSCDRELPTKSKTEEKEDKKAAKKAQKVKDDSCLPVEDLTPRCLIKMQNPLGPLCCEVKSDDDDDDEPCPPEGYPQNPRVPGCGCDRCRQNGYHGRCCDQRTFIQQTAEPPPRLEKA